MARLRYNDVSSLGTTNPITLAAGATVCSWATPPGFAQSIAPPDIAVVVVEPDTVNEEIVWVTGWTLGATVANVTRLAEPSAAGSAIAHAAVAWAHGPTAQDYAPLDSGLFARTLLL